jgi:hypothetical protein
MQSALFCLKMKLEFAEPVLNEDSVGENIKLKKRVEIITSHRTLNIFHCSLANDN